MERTIEILTSTANAAEPTCVYAVPAWLDRSGVVTIGERPGDDAGAYTAEEARQAGAALTASLPQVEYVARRVAPPSGDSELTHFLHISDPLYAGRRTWLVRLEGFPETAEDAAAAGFEYDTAAVGVFRRTGAVH